MSVTSRLRRLSASVFVTVLLVAPSTGVAQSRLPWADANPLEQWFGKPGEERRPTQRGAPSRKRAEQARTKPASGKAQPRLPAVPTAAAVPVPAVRPTDRDQIPPVPTSDPKAMAGGSTAGQTEAASPPPAPVDRTDTAEPTSQSSGESGTPAAAAEPVGSDADRSAQTQRPPASADSADPLPTATDPATADPQRDDPAPPDPAAAATKPIAEIPVPEVRPADAPSLRADPPARPPVVEGTDEAEAPNSTEALKSRETEISPATAVIAAAAIEDAELCEAELTKRGVAFTVGDSISEGDCGVLRPLSVTRLSSGVVVSPQTQLLCRTALALDDWMSASVLPAAKATLPDHALTEFRHASTYVCRPRASENGISEHARGSAVDIAAFVFEGREDIGIAAQAAGTPEAAFQARVREGACGPFRTVLGPGTDADHATHFHLDIAARRNGATYCK